MKIATAVVVAVSLVAPSMALAQRHTTPGTAERHAANLADGGSDRVAEANRQAKGEDYRQTAQRTQTPSAAAVKTTDTNRSAASADNLPN